MHAPQEPASLYSVSAPETEIAQPDQAGLSRSYTLLSGGSGWKQLLALPTVKLREDGICFDSRISGRMLWLELESGFIWGIVYRSNGSFLSFRDLERIVNRLDEARFEAVAQVLQHLNMLFGWSGTAVASQSEQLLSEIAEDLVKESVLASKAWNHEYLLTDASVRTLSRPYCEQFQDAMKAFGAGLCQETLALARVSFSEPCISYSDYNYLLHPLEKIRRNRRQALQAYPLMHNAFTTDPDHRTRRLQHGVDSGNPLPVAVADYFRCSKTVARFLAEKDFELIGTEWIGQLDRLPDLLGLLKPDYWPKDRQEWLLLNQWLLPLFTALDEQRNRRRSVLLHNGLNDLAAEGYARIPARLEKYGVTLLDITTLPDFERAYREWSVQTGAEADQATGALLQVSLLRLAALCRRWHHWQAQLLDDVTDYSHNSEDDKNSWPGLIDSPWHCQDLVVVPLTTPWMLREEGNRMQHCVGSYASQCLFYGAHIFSIRERTTGKSLSTFELHLDDSVLNDDPFDMIQHRGHGNSNPSQACEAVLTAFLHHLKLAVDSERLREIRWQLFERREKSSKYQHLVESPAWSRRMIDGFRELLHDCPALAGVKAQSEECAADA